VVDKRVFDVFYVDYCDNDEIRRKAYANPGFKGRPLPRIDAVWAPGKRLSECVGDRRFGYAVASHVVEHVPNPVGWLEQILECLESGGRLALVVPDKRRTMDYYRPHTTFAQVVGWSIEAPVRPTATQIVDFLSQSFDGSTEADFTPPMPPFRQARRHYTDAQAIQFAQYACREKAYLDTHCTVWTPEGFVRVFRRVIQAGLLQASISAPIAGFPGSPASEFLVYLDKPAVGADPVSAP
jgi:hypothetical protein